MNCLICNNSEKVNFLDELKLEVKEDSSFFKDAEIFQCTDCDFSFVNPMPKIDDINFFYENVYRKKNRPPYWITDNDSDRIKNYLEDKNLSYLLYITTLVDITKIKNFYDFGCGDGDIGFALKKKFSNLELFCSESDSQCQKILSNRNYKNFKDISKIDKKFDFISTTHSLEHLTDTKMFSIFKNMLNPEGFLFFEVPNCTSEYFKGRPYDSPHLLFYTKKSLEKIALMNNFKIVNISTSAYSFDNDHRYQRESQALYEEWISSKFSKPNIKNVIKKFLPLTLLNIRKNYLKIKKNEESAKLDWFTNNVGNNCYIRGIFKKN
tara:strand:- start:5748 stop:6713 length:966 start_codon:yes stop_codon:yes gene_type:complete